MRGQVTVISGGVVGMNAAKIAIGMGARVSVLDISATRLAYLDDVFGNSVTTTSTYALTNVTLKYALAIARFGLEGAVRKDPALQKGANVYRGEVTHAAVAESLGAKPASLSELLEDGKKTALGR